LAEKRVLRSRIPKKLRLEIERALLFEKSQVAKNILFDFLRLGFGIDSLQVADNGGDGVLAIATLDDFEAGADQTQGAFGHEQDSLLIVFAKTTTGSKARPTVQFKGHSNSITILLPVGRRQGAASRD
jgi:hypothetical protein